MECETAGDPISGLKWTHRTTQKIAKELRRLGIGVCKNTVGRLLKKIGFSLRVNHRMLAYSSIAHAGYMLMGVVLLTQSGIQAIILYLVVYGLMNLGAFLVVIAMSAQTRREEFESYRGLGWRMPLLAVPMAIFMFSLTGIPPFAGFIGKVYLFKAVIEADLYWLALIGVLNSVVSLYYYMRIVKTMYLDDPGPAPAEPVRVPWVHTLIILALAIPTLIFGFRFGLLERLSNYSLHIFSG